MVLLMTLKMLTNLQSLYVSFLEMRLFDRKWAMLAIKDSRQNSLKCALKISLLQLSKPQ